MEWLLFAQADASNIDWPQLVYALWPWITGALVTCATGIGWATRTVWTWFRPHGDAILISWREFFDKLKTQHAVLENAALTMLLQANTIMSLEKKYHHRRNEILVVDDDIIQLQIVDAAVVSAKNKSERFKYATIAHVGTLDAAYSHIYNTIVIILDVFMPGSTVEDVQGFVRNYRSCPVIIYTAGDYSLEDFPGAYSVVLKDAGVSALSTAIQNALDSCPGGCES